jgi:hypothetical protein
MGTFLRVFGVIIFAAAFLFFIAALFTDRDAEYASIDAAYGLSGMRRVSELKDRASGQRVAAGIALVSSLLIL